MRCQSDSQMLPQAFGDLLPKSHRTFLVTCKAGKEEVVVASPHEVRAVIHNIAIDKVRGERI